MCGISGIFMKNGAPPLREQTLKAMVTLLRHRGPDESGCFVSGNLGLAISRLKVIDLKTGSQPIHNEDRSVWVVLNGEIYNYRRLRKELEARGHVFYTESDTEVIVHLYEEKDTGLFDQLEGMFAFAIADLTRKAMLVCRDRLGVKPLYYFEDKRTFAAVSELKALLVLPGFRRELDLNSLSNFFSLNYVPAPATVFKGVSQLPPGHYLFVDSRGVHCSRYWDAYPRRTQSMPEQELVGRVSSLLKQSVTGMLRSDVPLGALLSGGIDSSAVVSFAQEACPGAIKTFSVSFAERSFDESGFARLASRRFGTEHTEVCCTPGDMQKHLPALVWHADNLLADPSMLASYIVFKKAREQVTVCLSGDGGDELFMGYPTYTADRYARIYRSFPPFFRAMLRPMAAALPVSFGKLSTEYMLKRFIEGAEFPAGKAHYWWRSIFTPEEKRRLFSGALLDRAGDADSFPVYSRQYRHGPRSSDMRDYVYADMKVWLADDNLVRVDAMSMANSLEVRVPLLSRELVEFMAEIDPAVKMKRGPKWLLKRAVARRVPEEILSRRKSGWHIPLGEWFSGPLHGYLRATFADGKARRSGLLDPAYLDGLLENHRAKRQNNSYKLWSLLVFFNWYEIFG
jgi:asparagine synthase (glutamine-hydrolysing)